MKRRIIEEEEEEEDEESEFFHRPSFDFTKHRTKMQQLLVDAEASGSPRTSLFVNSVDN
jgi:hypothetical protein